ncbi:hypothetical protein MM188_003217 [Vibrio cholerae]|nr:hypothetical protein [Vibrio cholerae]
MDIAATVLAARQAASDHLGTEVQVCDALGNPLLNLRAIVSKLPLERDTFGNTALMYQIKFNPAHHPQHAIGQRVKTWRGNFYLHALIEEEVGRVVYSLRGE